MNRWRLWTTLISGALALGAPGTYFGWRQFAGRPDAQSQAKPESEPASAPSIRMATPIPVPVQFDSKPYNPIAPASFTDTSNPASSNPAAVVRGNDDAALPPVRPSSEFRPPGDTFPLRSTNESTSDSLGAPAPRTRHTFSDASTPESGSSSDTSGDRPPEAPLIGNSGSTFRVGDRPFNVQTPVETSETQGDGNAPGVSRLRETPSESPPLDSVPKAREFAPPPATIDSAPPASESSFPLATPPSSSSLPPPRTRREPPPRAAPRATASGSRIDDAYTGPPAALSTPSPLPSQPKANSGLNLGMTSPAPGDRKLEGVQTPSLSLKRLAPEEIQVGKLAKFVVKVSNVGQVPAHGVVLTDRVPEGTQFVESVPAAMPARDGSVSWELGTIQPGEESTIMVDLMPQAEGEIGSVAQLTFHAQVGMRTIATRPLLTVEHTGPKSVLIGDNVTFQIAISNPGSGVATGVVVEVDVPEQLIHEGGREIMSGRFDLRPNETRRLDLVMKAVQPGTVENIVRAVADANLAAEHITRFEVVAPSLQLAVNGPARRFLQRQANYQIVVANPGTAPANGVELVAYLPRGFKFVETEKKGQYDQRKHAVFWSLEELPPGESGAVLLSVLPIDTGEQKLHVEGRAALDLAANRDHMTIVEGRTELAFTVTDENDPIEVGAVTSYEIRVTNNGTKIATNVRLAAQLPPELVLLKPDPKVRVEGGQIVMEPVPQLRPGEELVYRLNVQGRKPGDHVVRVQILSDEYSTPVTKEESTKVYADE